MALFGKSRGVVELSHDAAAAQEKETGLSIPRSLDRGDKGASPSTPPLPSPSGDCLSVSDESVAMLRSEPRGPTIPSVPDFMVEPDSA